MDDINYRMDWEEKRELYATIDALKQEIEALRKEVAELKAKLAERESEEPYNPLLNRNIIIEGGV